MSRVRARVLALALTLLAVGCGGDAEPHPVQEAFAQRPPPVGPATMVGVLFPTTASGPARLFRVPTLAELAWRFDAAGLTATRVLGFSRGDDHILFRAPDSSLRSLELASGRVRVLDTMAVLVTIGPTERPFTVRADSTVAIVADRRIEVWPDALPALPHTIWGSTRERLVMAFPPEGGRQNLAVVTDEWDGTLTPIVAGPIAPSHWGDLFTVTTDSGLVVYRTLDLEDAGFVRRRAAPAAVAFSGSAHRMFLLQPSGPHLVPVERFELTVLDSVALDQPYDRMRSDRFGRYLYLGRGGVDSVSVFDTATERVIARLGTPWDSDLPAATADGTLYYRDGNSLVGLEPVTGQETGRVTGAAGGWIVIPWDPRRPTLQVVADSRAAQDSSAASDRVFYAQLSSTSNLSWATDRTNDLRSAGLPARIVMPSEFEDRFRVVLGPYPTRETAESTARRLGQAFFIISFDRADTTVTFR